jgi:hypothetical protein
MKKLVAILILLLAVETYGVFGRAQADKITYTCNWEVGPLCFSWEQNALGKLIGDDAADDLEEKLEKAQKAWEEDFVERLAEGTRKKNSVERALEDVKDAIEDASDAMKEAFGK